MDIKFIFLDNIDLENNKIIRRDINVTDAYEYISSILNYMMETTSKREYIRKDASYTMDKIVEIMQNYLPIRNAALTSTNKTDIYSSNINKYFNKLTESISYKLLQEQGEAKKKYINLKNGVQKGSLIQALVENNNEIIYLSCLIEHALFVDENDLKYKKGLPTSDKATLKSCLVYHSDNGDINSIFLTDTRTKFTEYWYDGFLELKEKRSDSTNTESVFCSIRDGLKNGLRKYQSDCNTLTTSLKSYFLQMESKQCSFESCLDYLFDGYKPNDSNVDLIELRNKIEKTAKRKNDFDYIFNIDNSKIKKSLTNIKYDVTDNIEIKFKAPKENLNDFIYSTKIEGDEKVLIIRNIKDSIYNKFLNNK